MRKALLSLLYGNNIRWSLRMDEMLRQAASEEGLDIVINDINNMTVDERELYNNSEHLYRNGLICPRLDRGYAITTEGLEYLSSGGYTAEAKRAKVGIFAFRISAAALIISIVSLIVSLFDKLGGECSV